MLRKFIKVERRMIILSIILFILLLVIILIKLSKLFKFVLIIELIGVKY